MYITLALAKCNKDARFPEEKGKLFRRITFTVQLYSVLWVAPLSHRFYSCCHGWGNTSGKNISLYSGNLLEIKMNKFASNWCWNIVKAVINLDIVFTECEKVEGSNSSRRKTIRSFSWKFDAQFSFYIKKD